jgi:hypothetical protein
MLSAIFAARARDTDMMTRKWTSGRTSGRGLLLRTPKGAAAAARHALLAASVLAPLPAGWCFDPRDLFAVGAGPVVFQPKLDLATTYSDNIYYLPDDSILPELGVVNSREDMAFILSPALSARLGRPDGENRVELDFRFDQILYSENPSSDSSNYNFDLSAAARGAKLSYDCRNSLQFLNSILNGYAATIEGIPIPSGNVERINVNLAHNFGYALSPKTRLLAGGTYSLRDYPGSELTTRTYYNSEEWRANAGLGYALSEKIGLDAKLHYGQLFRDPTSDRIATPPRSDLFGGTVGARGSFTPKLSGGVRAGYEYRWFSEGSGDDGYPIAGVDLIQQFTDRTSATLAYNHGGSVSATAFSRSVTTTDSVTFNVQQIVGYRRPWFLNLGVRYALTDYVTGDVEPLDNFQVSLGARYQIQTWLNVFANYAYEFGSRSTYDYDVNQVTLGFHLGF